MQIEPLLVIYLLCGFFTISTLEWFESRLRFKGIAEAPTDFGFIQYLLLYVFAVSTWPLVLPSGIYEYRKALSKVKKPKTKVDELSDKISQLQEDLRYYRNRENANQQQLFDMTQAIRQLQDTKQAEVVADFLIKEKKARVKHVHNVTKNHKKKS